MVITITVNNSLFYIRAAEILMVSEKQQNADVMVTTKT